MKHIHYIYILHFNQSDIVLIQDCYKASFWCPDLEFNNYYFIVNEIYIQFCLKDPFAIVTVFNLKLLINMAGAEEEPELKDIVVQSLESKGILGKIKVQEF